MNLFFKTIIITLLFITSTNTLSSQAKGREMTFRRCLDKIEKFKEKWENWALRRIQSNDPETLLQGLDIYREEKMGWPQVPDIISSYAKDGSHFEYFFLAVKNQDDAKTLKNFLQGYRTRALSRPKQDKRGAKVYWFAASVRQQQGNWMMKKKEYADWIAGFSQDYDGYGIWKGAYIVEILLDMPEATYEAPTVRYSLRAFRPSSGFP